MIRTRLVMGSVVVGTPISVGFLLSSLRRNRQKKLSGSRASQKNLQYFKQFSLSVGAISAAEMFVVRHPCVKDKATKFRLVHGYAQQMVLQFLGDDLDSLSSVGPPG